MEQSIKQKTTQEGMLRYRHLQDEDRELVDCLLLGKLPADDVPRPKSKVVKLFISSTFTDMKEERNALAENVYPRLRQYCRDKYGLDFQAVDMRWGVPPEATDDHSAPHVCLAELRHCQNLSIGPNFVAFIGQKYGSCPLPAWIIREEFEAIHANLEEWPEDLKVLDQCYLKDQNSIPAVYRLQPASTIAESTGELWSSVEGRLRDVLYRGADNAVEKSELSKESLRLLKSSVTALEVYEGIINIQREKDRDANCLLYMRNLEGMEDEENHRILRRFKDLLPETLEPNLESGRSLQTLRDKCEVKVANPNKLIMTVDWTPCGLSPDKHSSYLQSVCSHFYATVKRLVDKNMAQRKILEDDDLYDEVVQHWTVARDRCETFVGRAPVLQSVRTYLDQPSNQALVVFGESGSGKTSLMAKAVSMVNEAIVHKEIAMKTSVIVRFIGTSANSSSIHALLFSLCNQLAYISDYSRTAVPEDYTSLKVYFRDLIQFGNFSGVVVIFLDALDQLSINNSAHSLDWIPSRLAPNVKVIVSTLPEKFGILSRLQNKIDSNFIHLSALPATDCKSMMRALLEHSHKAITYPQWRLVEKAFRHCTLPLFITLTFQTAVSWKSYDNLPDNVLQYTVEASINALFQRLENKHGKVFVSRALAYVTAAKNGLSSSELEDVLSLDDDVLNSVFTLWEPPIRRIPQNLWSRLYLEISPFLVEREADDIVVLSWYHLQFVRTAMSRYLSNEDSIVSCHYSLAQYYMGLWSGKKKKPFEYQLRLMTRLGKTAAHSAACRYVPEQPLIFQGENMSERYNYRKLTQLPYSLILSGQTEVLKKECFCNLEWLRAKLESSSLQEMLSDFSLHCDRDINLVADAIRMAGSVLKVDSNCLGAEIAGRLLPHITNYRHIRALVRQCDLQAQSTCPLIPHFQLYSVPGGPLQYELEIEGNSCSADVKVFNCPDGILMTAKPYYSKMLKSWELTQGEPRPEMQLPFGEVYPTKDGKYICIFCKNRFVTVFKTDCGDVHADINYGYGEVAAVTTSNRYVAFVTKHGSGPCLVDVVEGKLLHRFSSNSCSVAISHLESFIVFNMNRHIAMFSLPLLQRKCLFSVTDEPMQLSVDDSRMRCYILTKAKLLLRVKVDLRHSVTHAQGLIEDMEAQEFVVSHSGAYLLLRSLRCLYIVDTYSEEVRHRFQKMPPGVFYKTMTPFTGAGFSPDDHLVIASRDAYIAVWETMSGTPVRLLQASVSPIVKIFTSDTINKVVALLRNSTIQVWDLNNLDADIQHSNEVIKGSIASVSVSTAAKRIICHGSKYPEAKILDLDTGNSLAVIQHTNNLEDALVACELSPLGIFAVTKARLGENENTLLELNQLLTDDILWNVHTQQKVYHAKANRYVLFNSANSIICFVSGLFHSSIDWTCNAYKVKVFEPDLMREEFPGSLEDDCPEFSVPVCCEFACKPVVLTARDGPTTLNSFYSVLQFCQKEFHPVTKVEVSRSFYLKLFIRTLLTKSPEENLLCVKDFLKFPDPGDQFVDLRLLQDNKLLLIYSKDPVALTFDKEHGLVHTGHCRKAAIIYDPIREMVLRHFLHIVNPHTLLHETLISRLGLVILDNDLRVFDLCENKLLTSIPSMFAKGCYKFALDGAYVVGISQDLCSVLVVRSADGVRKGQLFVHGKATCIDVGEDDRTVVVGCHDGRVMILSLIFDLSDPVAELVEKLPSRIPPKKTKRTLMKGDLHHMQQALPDMTRLAMTVTRNMESEQRRQNKFRNLAVLVIQKKRTSSQACTVQ